jgi:hypothetical protein
MKKASNEKRFERNYALLLQHLKLKGLQCCASSLAPAFDLLQQAR